MWNDATKGAKVALATHFGPKMVEYEEAISKYMDGFKAADADPDAFKKWTDRCPPKHADHEGIVDEIKNLGDGIFLRRFMFVRSAMELAVIWGDARTWWDELDADQRQISDAAVKGIRSLRMKLKEFSGVDDTQIDALYISRAEDIEIIIPDTERIANAVKIILKAARCLADRIYSSWRSDVQKIIDFFDQAIPDWQNQQDKLLDDPMKTDLLTNPHYTSLSNEASKMTRISNAIQVLHSDGCGMVYDASMMKKASDKKDLAIDTVAVTYAIYKVTMEIPKVPEADRPQAAKDVIKQIEMKQYTLPKLINDTLQSIANHAS